MYYEDNGQSPYDHKGGAFPYPGILLSGNEYSLFEFEILSRKQVKICFLVLLLLRFTFLDPFNLCGGKQEGCLQHVGLSDPSISSVNQKKKIRRISRDYVAPWTPVITKLLYVQ